MMMTTMDDDNNNDNNNNNNNNIINEASYPIFILSRFLESNNSTSSSNNSTASAASVTFNDAQVLRNTFVVYGPVLIGSFLLFCWVRRRFPVAYNLRQSRVDATPLAASQYGCFSWIWKLNEYTDDELLDECGLDSLCFLRLLRMGFKVSCFSILNAIWLMPLYATASAPGDGDDDDITDRVVRLTVAHVPDGSKRLIGTVLAAYFLFGYVMYLILQEFDWYIEKRHLYLRKPTVENYSVYVHNIPSEYRSNVKLERYFQQCFSEHAVVEAKLRIKAPAVQVAVRQRDSVVSKLQHAINYQNVKHVIPTHREAKLPLLLCCCCGPTVESIPTYAQQLQEGNAKVTRLIEEIETTTMKEEEDDDDASAVASSFDIEQPQQRQQSSSSSSSKRQSWESDYKDAHVTFDSMDLTSTTAHEGSSSIDVLLEQQPNDANEMEDENNNNNNKEKRGLIGHSVNLLKSTTNQTASVLASTTQGVASTAVELVKATGEGEFYPSGFVTFRTLAFCNAAQQMVHHQTPFAFSTTEAPPPDDVFWMNVGRTHKNLQVGQWLGLAGTAALCLLWTIPITFAASLSSVQALSEKIPFIADLIEKLPFLASVLEILAPLIVKVVNALLPALVTLLTLLEGPISSSLVESSNFSKLAAFMIIQTFFVSAISSSLLQSIEGLVENPTSIISLLAKTLPAQSTYFIQIIFVGVVVASAMEILRIIPIVLAFIRRFLPPNLTQEERETTVFGIRPLSDPSEFEEADNLAQIVLNFIVLLVYAVIAPLTVFIQAFCFIYLWVVYKHQFVYIYPKYPDSGGKVFSSFIKITTICMFIAEFTIVGLMALKQSAIATPMMIPLIIFTFMFNDYIRKEHLRAAEFLPSRECMKADLCISEDSKHRIFKKNAYLQEELRDKKKYPDNLTEERAVELGFDLPLDQNEEEGDRLLADDSLSYFSCENDSSDHSN